MDPINPIVPNAPAPDPVPTPAPADPTPAAPVVEDPAKLQQDREQALQDALDAALEQLNTPAAPAADPVAPATPAAPAPVPVIEPTPTPAPVVTPAQPASNKDELTESMARILKNQEELNQKYTNLELRDEMIAITSELRTAIIQYPHADEKAILAEVERGSDKSITDLAKESHEKYAQLVSNIEKSTEEKVRAQILKENEGKISVPQSAGSSSTPTPATPGMPSFERRNDDDGWADALKASKANLQ